MRDEANFDGISGYALQAHLEDTRRHLRLLFSWRVPCHNLVVVRIEVAMLLILDNHRSRKYYCRIQSSCILDFASTGDWIVAPESLQRDPVTVVDSPKDQVTAAHKKRDPVIAAYTSPFR